MSSWQTVSLSQAEINHIHHLSSGVLSDYEIIRLDITVDEASLVEVFETCQHL